MSEECPEPRPGRKENRGEIIEIRERVLRESNLGILILEMERDFCLGIDVLCFMERRRAGIPNSPVRRGMSGWFIGRLKDRIPRKPERKKTRIPGTILSSLKMR